LKCILLHENEEIRSLGQRFLSPFFNTTLGQIYGKLLSQADAIVFVSRYQRDKIVENMPHVLAKSHVVYNPVPVFEEEAAEGQDYGFYGGYSALKGFNVLLRALRNLAKPVKVHIAGKMEKAFRSDSLLLTYHGWLGPFAYRKLLKNTIATIFASICPEPSPYVIVESMLFGKVVIASAIGGVPEITDGAPGVLLFPPGDSVSLAKRIEQVESMGRDELFMLGRLNRDFVQRRFRNNETIDEFMEILNKVVGQAWKFR
jgi:glycosyltransferase involved in cell wall biosynthesis